MRYEKDRSVLSEYLNADEHEDMTYPTHMHANFELLYITSGEMYCTISGREYRVEAGQAILILPHRLHSYRTQEHSRDRMLIFSADYVPEFSGAVQNAELGNPVFTPDPSLLRIDPNTENRYVCIGKLYQLCGQALAQTELKPCTAKNDLLVQKILEYISSRYTEQITLQDMAKDLGYNYYYLSGFINDIFDSSFSDIVNNYRINDAMALLRTSDLSIAEVSSQCGFGTIRSFNRAFKLMQGITPKEYVLLHHNGQDLGIAPED